MPKLNLLGEKYGLLTVIEEAEQIGGRTAWKCQCECGKEITVITKSLRNGNTKSCGCLHKKAISKDIRNQRFGRLLALEPTEERRNGGVVWKCLCDCGNIHYATAPLLNQGKVRSCGCLQKEVVSKNIKKDITNQAFGKLTAKYPTDKRSCNGSICWCCECDCGNVIDVSVADLISGHVSSCGCLKSKGEAKIQEILINNHINFIKEKAFSNCRFEDTQGLARFDFYLPDYNTIIEYDGEQHFHQTSFYTAEQFNAIQQRDQFKNEYCLKNNISLIRIPYTDYNKLNAEYILERIKEQCTLDLQLL